MAKVKNNPLLKGISGMLGDVIVYREIGGKMVMSNRPKRRGVLTPHQVLMKSKFMEAVLYAKGQMLSELSRADYKAATNSKLKSAYSVAVADYLSGPRINSINTGNYTGAVGDNVLVKAIDDFRVVSVRVQLRTAANAMIEQGQAVQDPTNLLNWNYAATQANAALIGTRIIVTAMDKPGNETVSEVELV